MSVKRLSLVSNSCSKTERFGHGPSSVAGFIEDLGDDKFQVLNEKMIDYFGLCCVRPQFFALSNFHPIVGFAVCSDHSTRWKSFCIDVQESEPFP